MATYKLKRKNFSHLTVGNPEQDMIDATSKMNIVPEPEKNGLVGVVLGLGIVAAIFLAIKGFFGSKGNAGKYKASAEEIEAIKKELPGEYNNFRNIQNEVIKSCKFIFSSDSSLSFYVNTLPTFLNLNGEEWIAGWARETGKKGIRWAPILAMYNCSFALCYDFDNKYWFFIIDGKEYTPKENVWKCMKSEFENSKKIANERLTEYPKVLSQVNTYLDLNLKLIKKYGKV